MAKVVADRVLETSTTTGTGAYTLAGAVIGHITFANAPLMVTGSTCDYYAEDVNATSGVLLGAWETGLGTWSTGGILTRTTVYASSNAGAAVSWAAGTRRVGLGLLAKTIVTLGATGANGNAAFFENDQTITDNYTLTVGKNAGSFGPITITNGITVTVPNGATWSIT